MARSKRKQAASTPPAVRPTKPVTNEIKVLRCQPEQHYFIDEAQTEAAILFYAVHHGVGFVDAEHDVTLDGAVLQDSGEQALDVVRAIGLYVDPSNPDTAQLRVMDCSKQPFEEAEASLARISALKPPVLHASYNQIYAKQTWHELAPIMALNHAPMVFAIVAVPAFGSAEAVDVRLWVPFSPKRLSLAYGLTRLQAAIH